jgi:hypothetical protein
MGVGPVKAFEKVLEPGWLERLRAQPPAPTKAVTISRALKFAHTGAFRDWTAIQNIAGNGMPLPPGEDSTPLPGDTHRIFRAGLSAIVEGSVPKDWEESWISAANDVLSIRTIRRVGGKLREDVRYLQLGVHAPIDGMLSVALLWLLERKPSSGRKACEGQLCQCHYDKCERFFLAKKPTGQGGWRTMYCPPGQNDQKKNDHMTKAHNARAK